MLSQRIGDRYPPVKSCKLTGNLAAPTNARLNFPPDTEITFIPPPSQPSNRLFALVENLAGVPAACQCRWCGLVGSESLATVRSNLSSRHDNAGIHADTQFNPNS